MKKIILDTNFILTCVKQKIDFYTEIYLMGFEILIPIQVIRELKKIISSKKNLKFREVAILSLNILENKKFTKIDLEENYVDKGILNFAKKNPDVFVATLDKEMKKNLKNRKLVIRGKKTLEVL